ncbi:MAG: hypothetical protein WD036_10940 [Bauldia sp.]
MEKTEPLRIVDIAEGGPAKGGQDLQLRIRIKEGSETSDLDLCLAHDKLPGLVTQLITLGGMARHQRMRENPFVELDGTFRGGPALKLVDAFAGEPAGNARSGILTLAVDAGGGRSLNFYCEADRDALLKLSTACAATARFLGDPLP